MQFSVSCCTILVVLPKGFCNYYVGCCLFQHIQKIKYIVGHLWVVGTLTAYNWRERPILIIVIRIDPHNGIRQNFMNYYILNMQRRSRKYRKYPFVYLRFCKKLPHILAWNIFIQCLSCITIASGFYLKFTTILREIVWH